MALRSVQHHQEQELTAEDCKGLLRKLAYIDWQHLHKDCFTREIRRSVLAAVSSQKIGYKVLAHAIKTDRSCPVANKEEGWSSVIHIVVLFHHTKMSLTIRIQSCLVNIHNSDKLSMWYRIWYHSQRTSCLSKWTAHPILWTASSKAWMSCLLSNTAGLWTQWRISTFDIVEQSNAREHMSSPSATSIWQKKRYIAHKQIVNRARYRERRSAMHNLCFQPLRMYRRRHRQSLSNESRVVNLHRAWFVSPESNDKPVRASSPNRLQMKCQDVAIYGV